MKNKKTDGGRSLGMVGVAGAASLAAVYFFLGPGGKKRREHTKAWAIRMKADVVEKLEAARELSRPIYEGIINTVAAEYEEGMKAGQTEIAALARDLKKHWTIIKKEALGQRASAPTPKRPRPKS
jgi:hypothetical protein